MQYWEMTLIELKFIVTSDVNTENYMIYLFTMVSVKRLLSIIFS